MPLRWWVFYICLFLIPAALALVRRWLIAPIKMKRTQRLSARPAWEPTTPDHLTPEMQEFIASAVTGFRQIGFEVVLNARRPGGATHVLDSHQLLFINRTTNDLATALVVRTATTRSMVLALISVFKDGRRIVTSSRQQLGFLPRDPMSDTANFPAISNPGVLWNAHRRRLEIALRSRDPRVVPAAGQEQAHLEKEYDRETQRMVDCGYYYRDAASGDFRMTWKGAYLATWKLQQPIKRWRTQWAERKARRLWSNLGLANPIPAAVEVAEVAAGVAAASHSPEAPLGYDAALAPGEVRRSQDAAGVTIRIGTPSVLRILARRWVGLLYLAFLASMSGWMTFRFWLVFHRVRFLPPGLYRRALFSPVWYVWILLIALEGWRLARSLARARGTVVVVAGAEGLRYTNAIGRPHSGFVSRADFDKFMIVREGGGTVGYSYRLEVRFRDGRTPLALATGPAVEELQCSIRDLSAAMGLSTSQPPARAIPDE
jgi:hypothetical protein